TAQQGQTLTASPGSWTGSSSQDSDDIRRRNVTGVHSCALPISTGSTYLLTEADVGRTLRVAVVASNAAGSSAPASSAHTEVVTEIGRAPCRERAYMIAGAAPQEQTLTDSPGSGTGPASAYSYER